MINMIGMIFMQKKHTFLHGRTTVGERGQIVIPQNIRTKLKLKHGDEMIVLMQGEKILVLPAKKLEHFFETIIGQKNLLRKSLRKK